MKKIEYKAPEMEVVKLAYNTALLSASDGSSSSVIPPIEPSDEPNVE